MGIIGALIFGAGSLFPLIESPLGNYNYFSNLSDLWMGILILVIAIWCLNSFYSSNRKKELFSIEGAFIVGIYSYISTRLEISSIREQANSGYLEIINEVNANYRILESSEILPEIKKYVELAEQAVYIANNTKIAIGFWIMLVGFLIMVYSYLIEKE